MYSPIKNGTIRVLCLDGGGIRGLFAIEVLKGVRKKAVRSYNDKNPFNQKREDEYHLAEDFDLIAGTSTGAIIASALALRIPLEEIEELYLEEGCNIFKASSRNWGIDNFVRNFTFNVLANPIVKNLTSFFNQKENVENIEKAYRSIYGKHEYLEKILKQKFSEVRFQDVKARLLIPVANASSGKAEIYRSYNDIAKLSNLSNRKQKIRDIVTASCSAPTFFDPKIVYRDGLKKDLYTDGGIFANNPTQEAYLDSLQIIEYKMRLAGTDGNPKNKIQIISIGTGTEDIKYDKFNEKNWGFFSGWGGGKFIEWMLNMQISKVHTTVKSLLNESELETSYLRIDLDDKTAKKVGLDKTDSDSLGELQKAGEEMFKKNIEKISKFFD